MTWNLKRSLILGAVLFLGMGVWWQIRPVPTPPAPSEIESFQLTTDPEQPVLLLKTWGGFGTGKWTTVLTGDGAFLKIEETSGTSKTLQLSSVEMEDLVRIAVEGDLIGLDWETLQAKIREKYAGVRTMTDSPHIRIEISLAGAQTANGEELGPISSTFSCVCVPAILADAHPDVPETQALFALIRAISARFYPEKFR